MIRVSDATGNVGDARAQERFQRVVTLFSPHVWIGVQLYPLLCQPDTTQQISKPRIQAQIVHLGANSQQRKFVIALLISFFEPGERFVLLTQ